VVTHWNSQGGYIVHKPACPEPRPDVNLDASRQKAIGLEYVRLDQVGTKLLKPE
jgi:hypothetical protein